MSNKSNTMIIEKNSENTHRRERKVQHVTLVGSLGNLCLMLFKFFAGILGNSAAMIADAIHSLSDFTTDVVVVFFVRLAGKPQDEDHDFGHGKYETLATAVIGLVLLWVGGMIFWSGATTVYAVYKGEQLEQPGYVALIAAVASILVKEVLFQYTAYQAKLLNSKVMMANAWHHRSDALSSLGTMLGIGGAIFLGPDWRVLDPLAALVVSIFIVRVSIKLLIPCIDELLEKSLPKEDEDFIRNVICSYEGVADPHNLRTRRIGNYCAIEVHFRMNGETTIYKAHAITRQIEDRLRAKFGQGTYINTHVEPIK